jgi:hypothetical protein
VQEWCQQAENIKSSEITNNYRYFPQRVILLNHHNLPKDQSQRAKRSNKDKTAETHNPALAWL